MTWKGRRKEQRRLMVLGALYDHGGDATSAMAVDIMAATGLNSGRVYTALAQLHALGMVERVQQERLMPVSVRRGVEPEYERRDVSAWRLVS
jgi:DNA-binding IclR family transcriptional regulator